VTIIDIEYPEFIVSYSELATFRDCPLKHFLAYARRYTKSPKPGTPLVKGSLWHLVQQEHYKRIKQYQQGCTNHRIPKAKEEEVLAWIREEIKWIWEVDDKGERSDDQALIEWMYDGYVEQYGADLNWKIVGIEQKLLVPLPGEGRYILKAAIDLIVFDWETLSLWVVDHKSCGNLPTYMDLDIDDQFGLYSWMLRSLGKKSLGAIHSAARTTRNKGDYPDAERRYKAQTLEQRFKRTYMNRTDKELDNLAHDAYEAARSAWPLPGERGNRYSAPDPRQCGWKCDFKEAHLTIRKGRRLEDAMHEYGFTINTERH
jgi:hypothetical protein